MNLTINSIDSFCNDIVLRNPGSGKNPIRSTINMQSVTFVEPFALIYLGMFINYQRGLGYRFKARPPQSQKVREYLNSQKFWLRHRFNADSIAYPPSMGYLTSFNDIVEINSEGGVGNNIGDKVREMISRDHLARRNAYEVGELVSELVDNFAQHSQETHAACVVQRYPKIGRTDFAIGDCGIGIRKSLVQNSAYEHLNRQTDREAAQLAFTPGVSRRTEGGMGLGEVSDNVQNLNGQLFLATGNGWVLFHGESPSSGDQECYLPGVQVEVSIPDGG